MIEMDWNLMHFYCTEFSHFNSWVFAWKFARFIEFSFSLFNKKNLIFSSYGIQMIWMNGNTTTKYSEAMMTIFVEWLKSNGEIELTKRNSNSSIHLRLSKFTCGLSNRSIDGRLEYSSFIMEPGPPFPLPPSIAHDCCDSAECGGGESSMQWHWLSWHWALEMKKIGKIGRERSYRKMSEKLHEHLDIFSGIKWRFLKLNPCTKSCNSIFISPYKTWQTAIWPRNKC